jgi:hypothetical protein
MNDDLGELRRSLEHITACGGSSDREQGPDAESAALRTAWLAFGQLLESAETDTGSAARPLRLAEGWPNVPARRRGHRRLFISVAAMAASVLLAVTAVWHWQTTRSVAVRTAASPLSNTASLNTALPNKVAKDIKRSVPPATSRRTTTPAVSLQAKWQWDDAVDREIEVVGRAAVRAQQGQEQLASLTAVSRVQNRVESMRQAIDANAF